MNRFRCRGYSITELSIVIAIVAIVGVVATPNLSSGDAEALELGASEVASAIRFARSEAIRTGQAHGISVNPTLQEIKVFALNGAMPPLPEYTVRHPVAKQFYTLSAGQRPAFTHVQFSAHHFKFVGLALPLDDLAFNRMGRPIHDDGTTIYRLEEAATVTLSRAGLTRTVGVDPLTGRVTVASL